MLPHASPSTSTPTALFPPPPPPTEVWVCAYDDVAGRAGAGRGCKASPSGAKYIFGIWHESRVWSYLGIHGNPGQDD